MAIDWNKVNGFSSWEFDDPDFPGSGEEFSPVTLEKLVHLRRLSGSKIIVHRSVGGGVDVRGTWGHSPRSLHRLDQGARAADVHILTKSPPMLQLYWILSCGFGGVGWYPWWKHPGWHLDSRPGESFRLWVSRRKGRYEYFNV